MDRDNSVCNEEVVIHTVSSDLFLARDLMNCEYEPILNSRNYGIMGLRKATSQCMKTACG